MPKKRIFNVDVRVEKLVADITGWDKKMNQKFSKYIKTGIKDTDKSMVELDHLSRKYWANNVYKPKHFNARDSLGKKNSEQLGRSLYLKRGRNGKIDFKMHRLTHDGSESSGGKDWDYGRYLRNDRGFTNSPQKSTGNVDRGTYNSYYDKKVFINKGQQPINPKYWNTWKKHFTVNFRSNTRNVAPMIVREYFARHGIGLGRRRG